MEGNSLRTTAVVSHSAHALTLTHPPLHLPRAAEDTFDNLSLDGYEDMGRALGPNSTVLELWQQDFPHQPSYHYLMRSALYVDQRQRNATIAHLNSMTFEPLGVLLATYNTSYSSWDSSPPPRSAFQVQGLEDCPMDCGFDGQGVLPSLAHPRLAAAAALGRRKALHALLSQAFNASAQQ